MGLMQFLLLMFTFWSRPFLSPRSLLSTLQILLTCILQHIFRLHDLSTFIVSDRHSRFTFVFFQRVFDRLGVCLNPIPTRGGGALCPYWYTSWNISRTPRATDIKFADKFWKQKYIFQPPPPTLAYYSNVQSWRMFFEKHISAVFMQKHTGAGRFFFCFFHEVCPKCRPWNSAWWRARVLVTIFVSHPFRASTGFTALLSSWHQEGCHSIWFFISFQKRYLCCLSTRGPRFSILNRDSPSKTW